LINTTVLLGSW